MKNALLRLACAALGVVVTIGLGLAGSAGNSRDDPFQFLAPWIIVSEAEKARLDRDEAIVRTLSGDAGQLAVFVLSRLTAQADALVAWTRSIAELKRSKFVLAIRVERRCAPAVRIVNLETSVTHSDAYDRGKGIHYRMQSGRV